MSSYLSELLKISDEHIEKYKKPFANKEKVYNLNVEGIQSEDKILLSNLLNKKPTERLQRKTTIQEIKTKIKKFQVISLVKLCRLKRRKI